MALNSIYVSRRASDRTKYLCERAQAPVLHVGEIEFKPRPQPASQYVHCPLQTAHDLSYGPLIILCQCRVAIRVILSLEADVTAEHGHL